MKQVKRLISMFLALCLALGVLPSTALAANANVQFSDVNTSDWFYEAIQYVSGKGIMNGTSTTTFSPNGTTTRGMVVTVLHRMEDTPIASGTAFSDVPTGQWYSDAVAWASKNEIVNGVGNNQFCPNDAVTREQLAVILYRYAKYKNYNTDISGDTKDFSDASKISAYATDGMKWAIGSNLIAGTDKHTLTPGGNATRAQVATILMRFSENIIPTETSKTAYTIVFDLNYGTDSVYRSQTVKFGEMATQPSNPTRNGYSFSGWFESKSGGSKFNFSKKITTDMILYAHWIPSEDYSNENNDILPNTLYVDSNTYISTPRCQAAN